MVEELNRLRPQDGYVSYPWERRMQELLSVPNSSNFLSILLLPKASDQVASRYNDLEDTLARANAWLNAAQASGVPIVFMNIQTESLLTKVTSLAIQYSHRHAVTQIVCPITSFLEYCSLSLYIYIAKYLLYHVTTEMPLLLVRQISGETASSTVSAGSLSDLANLTNASLYGFEDYHGVDIGVVRAVRLWYAPLGGEFSIEIKLREGDTKLGFAISRTEEVSLWIFHAFTSTLVLFVVFTNTCFCNQQGFIFVSSVIDGHEDLPAKRSGLSNLYKIAANSSKLLVVSRVSDQKVLPWLVSSTGAIRCFDTVSLSQKLSLHRHAKAPIQLHVFLWDPALGSIRFRSISPSVLPLPPEVQLAAAARHPNEIPTQELPSQSSDAGEVSSSDGSESRLERDTAGDVSFRFHEFSLSNNWV